MTRIRLALCLLSLSGLFLTAPLAAQPAPLDEEAPLFWLASVPPPAPMCTVAQEDTGRGTVGRASVEVCAKCYVQCSWGTWGQHTECATCNNFYQACLDAKQLIDLWISENFPPGQCYKRHCNCVT